MTEPNLKLTDYYEPMSLSELWPIQETYGGENENYKFTEISQTNYYALLNDTVEIVDSILDHQITSTKMKKNKKEFKKLLKIEVESPFPNFVLKRWIEDLKHQIKCCPCTSYLYYIQRRYYCPNKTDGFCLYCERTKLWKKVIHSSKWKKYCKILAKTLEKVVENDKGKIS